MSKRTLITLFTILIMAVIAGGAIILAKGYTFSPTTGKLQGTGIISITSVPESASVYIDGHLTTATNATISSLSPKTYDIKIVKDGFIPWEKKVDVHEGLVSDLKVTLFPAIPTIYPLTVNGAVNPILSPDGQRLAFEAPVATVTGTLKQKGGIWIWNLVSQPISFVRGSEPHQIVFSTDSLDFTKAKLRFSPDSKQILATIQDGGRDGDANTRNYLLNVDSVDQSPSDVTPNVSALLKSWDEDQKAKDDARVLTIKDLDYRQIASTAAVIKWSPDETKFMTGTPAPAPTPSTQTASKSASLAQLTNVKVYDTETHHEYTLPQAKYYQWLPDSRHVILVQDGQIAVADFDGTNPAVVYAGNFLAETVFPWPDYSRLVFITSFPTPTASQPNLYGINLK